MNTPELLEQAEHAIETETKFLRHTAEYFDRNDMPGYAGICMRRHHALQRVLDAMRATLTAIPVVAALVLGAGQAKAADQNAAIAKAEQKVELATCQLNFLQQRPGAKKNDREYFGFMFQCLSK